MENSPEWLPEIVNVDGEWKNVLLKLYEIFKKDFKEHKLLLGELLVWYDRRILDDKFEEGFWHLITRKNFQSDERLLDNRRAERLPWCRPTIELSEKPEIKKWDYKEGNNKIRTYLWIEKYDYVVILEKRKQRIGEIMFLITAYHLDGDSSRKKMMDKYNKRL